MAIYTVKHHISIQKDEKFYADGHDNKEYTKSNKKHTKPDKILPDIAYRNLILIRLICWWKQIFFVMLAYFYSLVMGKPKFFQVVSRM